MTEPLDARSQRKVPDGKLIRVDLAYDDRIDEVRISGDFFIEPPAARAKLEHTIEGLPADVDHATLLDAIRGVDASLIGFSANDLADLTEEALR